MAGIPLCSSICSWQHRLLDTAKLTNGQGHTSAPSHSGSASGVSSRLIACSHIHCMCTSHAGAGVFEPAAVGRPLSSLQHPQLGSILILWSSLQRAAATVSHCCLPLFLAPGKVPGICWKLGYFFPITFTKRTQFLSVSLFVFSFR